MSEFYPVYPLMGTSSSEWPIYIYIYVCVHVYHPQRRNVTTSMFGLKNDHMRKNLTQNGEPQRSSWGSRKEIMYFFNLKKRIIYLFIIFTEQVIFDCEKEAGMGKV